MGKRDPVVDYGKDENGVPYQATGIYVPRSDAYWDIGDGEGNATQAKTAAEAGEKMDWWTRRNAAGKKGGFLGPEEMDLLDQWNKEMSSLPSVPDPVKDQYGNLGYTPQGFKTDQYASSGMRGLNIGMAAGSGAIAGNQIAPGIGGVVGAGVGLAAGALGDGMTPSPNDAWKGGGKTPEGVKVNQQGQYVDAYGRPVGRDLRTGAFSPGFVDQAANEVSGKFRSLADEEDLKNGRYR